MNAPFLVKQYLSNDLEQGSYSKIFWYYPLQKEHQDKGGIGLFFEVLYGDVDYEIYEQISKRFWDTFSDYFYLLDFEESLRKAIQVFTQLLRGFGVEDGLDVNIVLFNARRVNDLYQLKVISFGDADIFVIRDKKVADISELVPKNKTLRDVKFLELDLERNDVLLLGNKTLLKNAFDSDIIALDSVEMILESLAQFKENLFGSKKVFLIAAYNAQPDEVPEKAESPLSGILNTIRPPVNVLFGKFNELKDKITKIFQKRSREVSSNSEDKEVFKNSSDVSVPSVIVHEELNEFEDNSEGEIEVSDDKDGSIRSEEISEEVSLNQKEEVETSDENDELKPYRIPTIPPKKGNYADSFRSAHSPMKKVLAHPLLDRIKEIFAGFTKYTQPLVDRLQKIRFPMQKIFIEKNNKTGRSSIQWVRIAIIGIIIFFGVLYIRGRIIEDSEETMTITSYKTQSSGLQKYYDDKINPITITDADNELETCFTQVANIKDEISKLDMTKVKSEVGKATIQSESKNIDIIEVSCTTKYDALNGITRYKDAKVITDFKVLLGNDSNPIDFALKQGLIIVADLGRKAIYQVNPVNNNVIKLEDPQGLIKEPVSVGTGEEVIFVCDKQSGVLYFESNNEGFKRIVGLEPGSVGACSIVKGFGRNVYVVPESKDRLLRAIWKNNAYELPTRYIESLAEVRDVVIDGNIYFLNTGTGITDMWKFFGGKRDAFGLSTTAIIDNPTSAYTNPSDSFGIYIYDKAKNKVVEIEKATAQRHPGTGTLTRTFIFQNNEKFGDIKDIAVNLADGRELFMYILNGSSIWQVSLPAKTE